MKRGTVKEITILNNWNEEVKVNAVYIGGGQFSKVYLFENRVYVYTLERDNQDYTKEILCDIEGYKHLPEVNRIGTIEKRAYGKLFEYRVYSMPLYNDLTPRTVEAWSQFKIINKVWNDTNKKDLTGYEFNQVIIEKLRGLIPNSIIESLEVLSSHAANYGKDYIFEFPKCNLKVDNDGNLILLDVIFSLEAV